MSNVQKASKSSVGQRVIAGLEAQPDFVDLMVASIMTGLRAEVVVYTKGNPEGQGKPDGRTRLEAFSKAMAYAEGLPLARSIQVTIGSGTEVKTPEELAQGIAAVPELASAFRRELEKAERAAGRSKEKPAIPAG